MRRKNAFATLLGRAVKEAVLSEVPSRTCMAHECNLVLDPICGMRIEPKKAAATRMHDGMTYCFCSPGCVSRFDADPEKGHAH
jgi:YHS domain-containing protein